MRAYFLALGLTTLMIGLPLLLAGEVRIGCTTTDQGGTVVYSDCGGADNLLLGGEILVIAAIVFFAGSFVPSAESRYK
jgi:hypothetical protein